jgi:RsmE family RNA methyltransferase
MNLVLLHEEDFIGDARVRLTGRRLEHVTNIHRANVGDTLTVGVINGKVGRGTITRLDDALELEVTLDSEPPPKLPLTLVLALPRPKVLNRVIASATSLGAERIVLINAWRVEKSYWKSPRLSEENLELQRILGLEQARDTVMPELEFRRFFRDYLDNAPSDTRKLVAHPQAAIECPRDIKEAATLVIGPEGGFIEQEVASLIERGFEAVTIGNRILRVETAVAALIARLF